MEIYDYYNSYYKVLQQRSFVNQKPRFLHKYKGTDIEKQPVSKILLQISYFKLFSIKVAKTPKNSEIIKLNTWKSYGQHRLIKWLHSSFY